METDVAHTVHAATDLSQTTDGTRHLSRVKGHSTAKQVRRKIPAQARVGKVNVMGNAGEGEGPRGQTDY